MSEGWIDACAAEDIDEEDVIRFDHGGRTFAIYRTDDDRYFATDGLCTHEHVHLSDGLMMGAIIECPKHNGRFDFTTGEAKGAPACVNLETYFHLAGDGRLVASSAVGPIGKVAKDARIAVMLIAGRAKPDPAYLAAGERKLKALLAA